MARVRLADPEPGEVRRIAAALRGAGYETTAALRAILLSDAFWSPANRGALVKAPVDFVIGTLRTLNVDVPDSLPIVFVLRNLGQDLFAPPNVRGWPGGEAWINSTTLLARKQFVNRLLRAEEMPQARRVLREELGKGAGRLGEPGPADGRDRPDALRQRRLVRDPSRLDSSRAHCWHCHPCSPPQIPQRACRCCAPCCSIRIIQLQIGVCPCVAANF